MPPKARKGEIDEQDTFTTRGSEESRGIEYANAECIEKAKTIDP